MSTSKGLPRSPGWPAYAWSTVLTAVATVVALLGRDALHLPDVAMLYLLGIVVASYRFGRGPAIGAAALSVASYDYFFVPPFFTFSVEHTRHVLTFAMMFGLGLVTSNLTSRLREHERQALQREERTAALYALSRDLAGVSDVAAIAAIAARQAAAVFGCKAFILLRGPDGDLTSPPSRVAGAPLDPQDLGVARWASDHLQAAGAGTGTLPAAGVSCHPLPAGASSLGVLVLKCSLPVTLDRAQREFLDLFARQVANALDRARLAEEAQAAALHARSEELRSSLLMAVSHDLRTPLATITGAATALRDGRDRFGSEQRAEFVDTICSEAERMERLVRNILDMVRIESGELTLRREWVPLEEVLGSALVRLDAQLQGREVRTALPDELLLVPVDPVLFEQVFVNLLENAVRHTPPGSPVDIGARVADHVLEIEVADRGPGIPAGQEERIFGKFQRGLQAGAGGVGLGLSICRGIVEAHGGTVVAASREGGGTVFRIRLPLGEPPPTTRPEETGEERP